MRWRISTSRVRRVTDEAGRYRAAWWPRSSGTLGELYPRVGFIVTNLSRLAERVVAFYNKRGTCEQDQARQGSDQVDAAVMLLVRRQRCASSASCVGLQSRQLHADAGAARGDQAVVADQPAGETCEDRRQGRAPWPLRHLPDGRGAVPRNCSTRSDFAADRGTTATVATSACVKSPMVMCSRATDGRSAFKSQMARSDPRPPFGLPVVAAVESSGESRIKAFMRIARRHQIVNLVREIAESRWLGPARYGVATIATHRFNHHHHHGSAYARARRDRYSELEQFASRGARSPVQRGRRVSGRVHKIAACRLPA